MQATRDVAPRYDLFVSYARADNQAGRVTEFIDQVVADYAHFTGRRLRYFFDKNEIRGMDDWRHRICGALRESRLLIAFLSPSFVTSDNCRWEVNEYRKRQVELALLGEGIAPIYFVRIPAWRELSGNEPWLSIFDTTDRFNDAFLPWHEHGMNALREQAVRAEFQRLNTQLRDRLRRIERTLDAPGNVNRHNERFVGREGELRTLHAHVGLGKVGSITILHGLGGIGKTALATEYAHVYAHMYPGGRWQVNCGGHAKLAEAVSTLAVDLDLEQPPDPEVGFRRVIQELGRRAREGAIRWRREWHDEEGVDPPSETRPAALLLLDNVDNPALLGPEQAGRLPSADFLHVLATTRLGERELDPTQPDRVFVAVDELLEDEALDLLRGYMPQGKFDGEAEERAAKEVVGLLGRYALAVESIAVYAGYFAGSVTYQGVLAKLRTEGLIWLDQAAAKAAAHAAVRHGEQRLAATLMPTWELLDAEARRVLTLASLLPADRVVLAWVRAVAGEGLPALARGGEPGEPDEWLELVRRLRSLRLFQPTGDAGVEHIHPLVREFLRARMSPEEDAAGRDGLVRHVEDRGRAILRSWAGDLHRDEIAAILAFARELASKGEDHWEELVRCARVYCTLTTRIRGAVDLLERWAARRETDRLRQALDEDPDEFRRGLYSLAIATLLARHGQDEQALESWAAGLPPLQGPPLGGDGDASIGRPTMQLALALGAKGEPSAPAVPTPRREVRASPGDPPATTRVPRLYRALIAADRSMGRLLIFAFSWHMLVGAPLAIATLLLDPWTRGALSTFYDRWLIWFIGTPFLLAIVGMAVVAPFTGFALKHLSGRIGRLFAGLARASERDPAAPGEAVLRQAFELYCGFRTGSDERKQQSWSWTGDVDVLVRRGFPRIAADPAGTARAARLVESISAAEPALVEALVASLAQIDPYQLQAIVQILVRRPRLQEPALRVALLAGERLPDAGVLADLLRAGEPNLESFDATVPSRLECLGRLSSASLGKALLASLAAEKGSRPAEARAEWRAGARRVLMAGLAKFGAADLAGDPADQTPGRRLLVLLFWPGVLMFRLMFVVFDVAARAAGQLVLAAGRLHDPYALARVLAAGDPKGWRDGLEAALARVDPSSPGGKLTVPAEVRRLREALLAQHLLGDGRRPSPLAATRKTVERVLPRLTRLGLLGSRPQLLLRYVGDREWLEIVARTRPPARGSAGNLAAIGEPERRGEADRLQLRRAVPLRPFASWVLSTVLAVLLTSCWLGGTAALMPREARGWLFPYAGAVGLGTAAALAAVSHIPSMLRAAGLREDWLLRRLLLYRVLLGVAVLGTTAWAYGRASREANRDGVGMPGLDYGWTGLSYVIPLVPVVLAGIVVPELIARWRGGAVLYPTAGRLRLERLSAILAGAAVCMTLAGACALLALGSPLPPEPTPWPADGDRGADLIAEATVDELRTKDVSIQSVTGGRRGLAWDVHLVLDQVRLDRPSADGTPFHVHTRRVVAWPRTADGRVVAGASGQWFLPRRGDRVRVYLNHRPKGPYYVVLPNGIDRLTDDGVTRFHSPEPLPGPSQVIRDDSRPFGEELGIALLGSLLGLLLLALAFAPFWALGWLYRRVRLRWGQRRDRFNSDA